jgi:8-oxo-dGTP diphosphatase
VTDDLSEEDATAKKVAREVERLLDEPVVLCTHRKVLPTLFEVLQLEPAPLDKGGMVVVHHRKGRIAALERIPAPSGR